MPAVEKVHGGYFSISNGKAKDTSGKTKADDEVYQLIMRDNPDWAIIKQSNNETPKLVLVRETKGTIDESNMRKNEVDKIHCGTKHYSLLGVDYKVIVSANDL